MRTSLGAPISRDLCVPLSPPLSLGLKQGPQHRGADWASCFLHLHPSPERPGRHPAQGWPHAGEDALCHVFRGRLPFQKTMARSGTEEKRMSLSSRLAHHPQGLAALSQQLMWKQTLGWQRARSLPGLQVLLFVLSLLPMTFPHSGIPKGHSDPEGSGSPSPSVPPRALTQCPQRPGAPCLSVVKGEPVCPGHLARGM